MSHLAELVQRLGVSNLLALLGVLLIVAAVGALAGPWWAVLLLGVVLVLMGYVAHAAESKRGAPAPAAGRAAQ